MYKFGTNDNITPTNCKSGIHYVFNGSEPHGDRYAAISQNLAHKYKLNDYVPFIVNKLQPTKDIRKALNIPEDALVIGRHGGLTSFDITFVYQAIQKVLELRKDVYFLFLSTPHFINHERAMFFPAITEEKGIYNFVHACDIMIHGREMGETFGLAIAEFSACNKPVMTWSGISPTGQFYTGYDTAHIDQLQGKAILYNNYADLVDTMSKLDVTQLRNKNWDTYTEVFSQKNVINQFNNIFLK
jgi:glycosyltransferase involved in cell wall biosynthesis